MIDLQTIAMAVSFTGLMGVSRKRPWGPLVCGIASSAWCAIAFADGNRFQWAAVEFVYAVLNYGIALRWWREDRGPRFVPVKAHQATGCGGCPSKGGCSK